MRSTFLARTRRWIGASALAILVGLGGGTAFLAATSQPGRLRRSSPLPRSPCPPSASPPALPTSSRP